MKADLPELVLVDAAAWSQWLADHSSSAAGVWLVLARKGTTEPTRLSYDEALEAAICHGWVDGQLAGRDDGTFRRRFTPRRPGSMWSKRNVGIADRLISEGRMQPAGLAAIERAKRDGSWEAAYEGQARIEVPADLTAALKANSEASAAFKGLNSANRYAVLYRITTAKRPENRQRRIEQLVAMLARGDTIHPNR
jgi:uncharacterized protein YdeI (YjbR/CyaY-like superfamily)